MSKAQQTKKAINDASGAPRDAVIAVYGDGPDKALGKEIWSAASPNDIAGTELLIAEKPQELIAVRESLLLVFVRMQAGEQDNILQFLQQEIAAPDLIAVTENSGEEDRLRLRASGFSDAVDVSVFKTQMFRELLSGWFAKARKRQAAWKKLEDYDHLRAALSANSEAIIIMDEDRRVQYVSDHYPKAYPERANLFARGTDAYEIFKVLSEDAGLVHDGEPRYEQLKNFWQTLTGTVEFRLDSGKVWRIKAMPLDDGGTIVTTVDVTDYTEQKENLEEKSHDLEDALEKEKESSAIQQQFINMVRHEFRTPLSIIDGNAQILQRRVETLDEETIRKKARIIRSAVSHLIRLMEGVLSSNMLKTGQLELVPEPLPVREIIENTCEEHALLASTCNITCDASALPASIIMDKKALVLILSNLLSNAIKFSKEKAGNIFVRARVSPNGFFILEVEDEGIGIPSNEIEKIFERYYRTSVATGISGTGIGLHIVKELSELCGGTIEVQSNLDKGAIFTFRMPVKKET